MAEEMETTMKLRPGMLVRRIDSYASGDNVIDADFRIIEIFGRDRMIAELVRANPDRWPKATIGRRYNLSARPEFYKEIKMDIEQIQRNARCAMIKALGIEPGDTIKVKEHRDVRTDVVSRIDSKDGLLYTTLSWDALSPHSVVEVIKPEKFEEVRLNDEYTAQVYADKIVVGCSTFPPSIIAALAVAYRALRK